MAWPDDEDLDLTFEAAFGADLTAAPHTWEWTDLSDRLIPEVITVNRGTAVGATNSQISRGTVRITNEDGALTPFLPTSPYWPNVDTGTPARIRVRTETFAVTDTFTRSVSNGWGTADTGEAWTLALGSASEFSVSSGAGRVSLGSVGSSRRQLLPGTYRNVTVTFDSAVSAVATGAAIGAGVMLRQVSTNDHVWATVEFHLANAIQVKLWRVDGASTDLGAAFVDGLTYTAGQVIRTKVESSGSRILIKAWAAADPEPDVWHLSADTDHNLVGGGQIGIRDILFTGNTNALPVTVSHSNLWITEAPSDRLEGYIADVRPTFLPTPGGGAWSEVFVDVAGVGSRLEKQESPAWSPLRRSLQLAEIPPIAYWPLEDPEGASYGVSAYPTHPNMLVDAGVVTFGVSAGVPSEEHLTRYGTRPLVSLAAGGRMTAAVPLSGVTTEWAAAITSSSFAPYIPGSPDLRLVEWHTPGGTYVRWAFVQLGAGGFQVRAYEHDGTRHDVVTAAGDYAALLTYQVDVNQNGGNIDVRASVGGTSLGSGSIAGTVAPITRLYLNPDRVNTTAATLAEGARLIFGHIQISDDHDALESPRYSDTTLEVMNGVHLRADQAWYQEAAHQRIKRLCDEERVPCGILGDASTTGQTQLGAQQEGAFTDLITAAADAESGGLLYEAGFGYRYLPRSARYGRDVALAVDLATYQYAGNDSATSVLVPQLDARNATEWTIERTGGGQSAYAAPEEYRDRRGTIREQATLDLLRDQDTVHHAAWRVHLGMDAADARYPSLPVDLAANPELVEDWLLCDIGSRVQRLNQPTVAGYGAIDQVIEGYTEQLGPRLWKVSANCSPAGVWDVATVEDDVLGRPDTEGSELATGVDADDTSWSVATTSGPLWTTAAGDFPFPVTIAGEVVTVTNITGASSPQTFTVVRSVNGVVKSHSAGTALSLARPMIAAL